MVRWLILSLLLLPIRVQSPDPLELLRLPHPETVAGAQWSPDGAWVATWGGVHLYLWSLAAPEQPLIFDHATPVQGAVWQPDSRAIVTWAADVAYLWSLAPETPATPLAHTGRVIGATWNSTGSQLLTWGLDGTARLWPADGHGDPIIFDHAYGLLQAWWSGDEQSILAIYGGDDFVGENILVWSIASGEKQSLPHTLWVNGLRPGYDGAVLSWSGDGTAKHWRLTDELAQPVTYDHAAQVYHALWNGEGENFVTIAEDGVARLWTMSDPLTSQRLFLADRAAGGQAHPTYISGFAIWTGQDAAVSEVRIFGLAYAVTDPIVLYHEATILGGTWGSNFFLTWAEDQAVRVYRDLWLFSPTALVLPHEETIHQAAFSPDETRLLAQGNQTVFIWELP